ncbi:MAG: hypothetical protein M1830_001260 [Pleopsidium flavum]|nr:MAG: hypothetical protein M1830_001260 [Pleopsidium flavum]
MDTSPNVVGRGRGSSSVGGGSGISSPTRPGGTKRNRSIAGLDSSPGSVEDGDGDDGNDDRRRAPGVKRACNECRQQKLRCDVVQEPFSICSRCRRLNLECKIESNFKRIGKRSKNAEMEREIVQLRRQLANQQQVSPTTLQTPSISVPSVKAESPSMYQSPSTHDQYIGSQEAVASLLDLRSGYDGAAYLRNSNSQAVLFRRIDDVSLTIDRVRELFKHFFTFYHAFLPLLDPDKSPDEYYNISPLLFWTIISVAARRYQSEPSLLTSISGPLTKLIWSTLADVPQSYHVVKALCVLCTWPLPVSSTSSEPTFMLSGVMMQVAMQIGLHRPSYAQDFTKFRVELREEELKDRVRTWAACNIVAQRVATGYGLPPSTLYDCTLSPPVSSVEANVLKLSEELEPRLRIEKLCDKVTKRLYQNDRDPIGLAGQDQRATMTSFLAQDFEELEVQLGTNCSTMSILYLRAAGLHLRLSAFFDSSCSNHYREDLLSLWLATTDFLERALSIETSAGGVLIYASNYILQMITAAGFTLLKLLNSFFATHIDLDYGKNLFTRTIWAIRTISVTTNDLPSRLAEVLAQLWRGGGAGSRMDLNGDGSVDTALKNPTNPDSAAESSASSVMDPSLAPAGALGGAVTPGPSNSFGESNYEVFDPLNWMLDGFLDFPYSLTAVQGLEAQGMA